MSVRLDRLQQGLFQVLEGVADDVAWSYGQQPRNSGTLVSMRVLAGPTRHNRTHLHGRVLLPAESLTVTVVGSEMSIVRLNGFDYRDESGGSVQSIRDALLAAIQFGEAGAVTAVANGTDAIDLTADFLGGLRTLRLIGDVAASDVVFSGNAVMATEGATTVLVQIQAFSPSREPRNGAVAILDDVLDRLASHDAVDELARYGVGLWGKGGIVDLSAIAGGGWESRANVDITCAARTVAIAPVEQITTANLEIEIDGVAGTVEVTATAP